MITESVGAVEVLRVRIYPLDAATEDHPLHTEVVVAPGTYPVYRDAEAYFWLLSGKVNGRQRKIGDGMFVMGGPDEAIGPTLTFPSRRYGPQQLAEFMAEPMCTDGHPDQRLRFIGVVVGA